MHNQTKREQLFIVVPLLHWIFREFKSSVWTWLMRDFQSHFQNPAWGLQSVITADIKKIAHIKNSWSTRTKRSIFCSILRTLKFVFEKVWGKPAKLSLRVGRHRFFIVCCSKIGGLELQKLRYEITDLPKNFQRKVRNTRSAWFSSDGAKRIRDKLDVIKTKRWLMKVLKCNCCRRVY